MKKWKKLIRNQSNTITNMKLTYQILFHNVIRIVFKLFFLFPIGTTPVNRFHFIFLASYWNYTCYKDRFQIIFFCFLLELHLLIILILFSLLLTGTTHVIRIVFKLFFFVSYWNYTTCFLFSVVQNWLFWLDEWLPSHSFSYFLTKSVTYPNYMTFWQCMLYI